MKNLMIDVLGTSYTVKYTTESVETLLKNNDGCCDFTTKTIYIEDDIPIEDNTVKDLEYSKKKVLRHEIIHAFLYESGLHVQCDWAVTEEMVDWLAIQFEKINKAFEYVDSLSCLE